MAWYYPFRTGSTVQLKAWKRQAEQVDLASSDGHLVGFHSLSRYPESFPMRHYLFLSIPHALEKFVQRQYDPAEVEGGMHRIRAALRPGDISLLAESELRRYVSDDRLDPSDPRERYPVFRQAVRP